MGKENLKYVKLTTIEILLISWRSRIMKSEMLYGFKRCFNVLYMYCLF